MPDDEAGGRVLDALGDPTRRKVLELLRGGEHSVADLTRALPVTQSAVSQHLRVLKDAGLVHDRSAGTRRYYRVEREGLSPLRAYLDTFWDVVLDAFTTYAARPAEQPGLPLTDSTLPTLTDSTAPTLTDSTAPTLTDSTAPTLTDSTDRTDR